MRTNDSRTISKARLSVLALAAGFAAATASQGAFTMLTTHDLERCGAHNSTQGVQAVRASLVT